MNVRNVNFNSSQWLLTAELTADTGRPTDEQTDGALCSKCN